ncbi:glycosyltransferase family 1 protein [Lutibacter sp. HS1-25]|uniref:glycosyltransferase family 4 protein n=1 Tax=Lutibacter sp. HS1-25 TaxID=2485000 RepID=UPI0010133B59|nr:glycosyltransferase family 1 protein [Lutibacter sp. HS1-25]RXP45401.1 glycosyltransferase family 1 protein [Lutibacter sp. HS1-25]
MRVAVYIEPLKTFTSGMPHRGMLLELINLRPNFTFLLVLRQGKIPEFFKEYLNTLRKFKNCTILYDDNSSRNVNLKALLRLKNHCILNIEADVYLNLDANYLGDKCKPQIITVHDLSSVKDNKNSSIHFIKRFARKFTILNGIKYADKIITISKFTKDDIIQSLNYNKEIAVVYNGIDPLFFDTKLVIKENQNYFLWYGNFSKRKNLINLIKGYELVLKESNNLDLIPSLLLVGNKNSYSNKIENIINSSTYLKGKVNFKSQLSQIELIDTISQSRCILFPSIYEGFGLPIIESYAQGIPVIASNVTSLPEISGDLGILIKPHDIYSIKGGIQEFLKNSKTLNRKQLIKWASQFTFLECALNYLQIIEKTHNEHS